MSEACGAAASRWIFGYGSLIWRPDFDYRERRAARLPGWERRFWQGSHDHRGRPRRPGRVVTLVPVDGGYCDGMAYRVDGDVAARIFASLDHREKNGYERREVRLAVPGDAAAPMIDAVTYVAAVDNHAYLGPAPLDQMARQIASSEGPSGPNLDYLLQLAAALRALGSDDPHVFALEAAAHRCRGLERSAIRAPGASP